MLEAKFGDNSLTATNTCSKSTIKAFDPFSRMFRFYTTYPAGNYIFKVSDVNTSTKCEILLNLNVFHAFF